MSNTHISLWVHFRRPPVLRSSASITFLPSILKLIWKVDHQPVTVLTKREIRMLGGMRVLNKQTSPLILVPIHQTSG